MATSLFFVLAAMFELAILLLVNRILDKKEIGFKRNIGTGDRNSLTISTNIYHSNNDEETGINRTTSKIVNPWKLRTDNKSILTAVPLINAYGKLRITSKIDLVAFVTFTIGFWVFNVFYYNTFYHK